MNYFTKRAVCFALLGLPGIALATNGMNLEGYGPEALGMGGASMAYDNGSAASMNNPATIGLMDDGHRFDFALGLLGPSVTSKFGSAKADSGGDAYYMPALGWVNKQGPLAYGVGVYAQGGMGTEYEGNTFMSAGSGLPTRSEVSVGRFLVPLSYKVNDQFHIGGSIDYVWAGMDIQMAMSGAQMMSMMGPSDPGGTISGTLVSAMGAEMMAGNIAGLNWGYFDFSDDSDFTGEASSSGFAAKIGGVYTLNPQTQLGFTYHSKTAMGDLETSNAEVSMNINADVGYMTTGTADGNFQDIPVDLTGSISVKDFQWPAMFGLGATFAASDELQLVADIKRLMWSQVMKEFNMVFTADNSAENGGFGGLSMDATLLQEWEDQTIIALGGAYKFTPEFTGRAGYNYASNPIPDEYVNPLFPAITESHITLGAGYAFDQASTVDFALSIVPEVSQENSNSGVESSMSQLNWQLMYSYRY